MTLPVFVALITSLAAIVSGAYAWRMRQRERQRAAARIAALANAVAPEDASSESPLFSGERSTFANDHPFFRLGAAFALAVMLIVVIAIARDRWPAPETAAAQQQAGTSLALLSMRHERSDDTLTVTGLVRNQSGAPADGVIATVLVFDRGGTFLGSGRAPLEVRTLGAGEEAPFRVAIPHVSSVGRYRVSFRNDGGMIRHVDRRPAPGASTVTAALTATRRSAGAH